MEVFTFTARISVSREGATAVIFDEGIAVAISKEKSTADAPSRLTEILPVKMNTSHYMPSDQLDCGAYTFPFIDNKSKNNL